MELKFNPDKPEYEFIQTLDAANKAFDALEKEPIIGLDVESTGFDPYTDKLLLVQIGTASKSYIFDARKVDLKEMPRFKEFIENPKILKLMHNGKFDYGFIKLQTGAEIANIFDTMLSESILTAGLQAKPASLKELSFKYLDLNIEKEIRKTFAGFAGAMTKEQLDYSALDTLLMFPVFEAQLDKLKKENLINIAKLEFSVTRVVAEMELKGILINSKKWKEIIADLRIKRDKFEQDFYEAIRPLYKINQNDLFGKASDPINMNSNVQLLELFNNKLGLNLPSTGDAILETAQHPVARILRDYRGYEKLISAFGEGLLDKINKVTGRIHPNFLQLGAATGRFSCQNPNLQQIPRNSDEVPFRTCFMPAPGYKLVVADYSSMEMRILANESGDVKMIKALKDGLDIHSYTASLMFDKPYTPDFKKLYPQLRQIAKPIGFGLMYGMGPMGLAGRIGSEIKQEVTKEQGTEYMNKYFKSYPSVQRYLDKLAREAVEKGYSPTPAGRKRWYTKPDPSDPDYKKKISNIERQAKNHPIQGTNADVTKYAMVFIQEKLNETGVDGNVILTVHDEIVCEVREDQAEDWSKIHDEQMKRAGELLIKRVPTETSVFVGDVWEH
ncbi:MAG TPA: DNA polymerase [Candidatus Saccharimonadales bacterium]|nr:DNA polymerase [Candidatus Saccharimonadales bacterium]